MWFVYMVLFLGALASILNLVILIAMATLAVRMIDSLKKGEVIPKKRKKRRRGQMIEGEGLMDVDTPPVTYDMPKDIVRSPNEG